MLVASMAIGFAHAGSPRPLPTDKPLSAKVAKAYSSFLANNHGATVTAARVGDVVVVRFDGQGVCTNGKCFTTALVGFPAKPKQVLAVRAKTVSYIPGGQMPALVINGVEWDFSGVSGYVANLKTAGVAFVPNLQPHGKTLKDVASALHASGWPKGVPVLIREVKGLGHGAPVTLSAMPDLRSQAAQSTCGIGHCPVALLVPHDHGWEVSAITRGTGLMAVLRASYKGRHEIGIGQMSGYEAFGWSGRMKRWLPSYTSYKSTITPVP